MSSEEVEDKLSRLSRETEGIFPQEGFTARVMARVAAAERPSLLTDLVRSARRFAPAALAVALLGIGCAMTSATDFGDSLATVDDGAEIEW